MTFLAPLDLRYIDGRYWYVERTFVAGTPKEMVIVPEGFVTDLASIPCGLRWFFPPAGDGPNAAYGPRR
jgi:hypothetical protein